VLLFNGTEQFFQQLSELMPEPRPVAYVDRKLRFSHRYNSDALAQKWAAIGLAGLAEPNYFHGDGNDVEFDPITGRYTFWRKWGDCPAGCISRHRWILEIKAGAATLVEESGDPLP
jgi:hypothetical protein